MENLKGKAALVTGGSSGIGKAVAKRLAEEGCNLVLVARDEKKLKKVKRSIKQDHPETNISTAPTDIRDEDQVKDMVKICLNDMGRLDILVNNAGIIRYGELENFSTKDFHDVMETNVYGTFYATKAALPHLKESKGNLIFIGSFDANHPRSFNPIYCSSKWWVKGFAHSVESIVGKQGVAVTLINPSEVRTDIPDEEGKAYKNKFDQGEVTEPNEIADTVVFAAKQSKTTTLSQIDIYRRDKLSDFF
ncbi:MAG: SDR family oxidoreductase [Candidatus Saliniplasma sp.]